MVSGLRWSLQAWPAARREENARFRHNAGGHLPGKPAAPNAFLGYFFLQQNPTLGSNGEEEEWILPPH